MIDFWPLIGVVIITLGLAFKLNTLMVILTAGHSDRFGRPYPII